jgi:hypothetical protein
MQNVPTQQKPEWVRAPSRGQEYFSGFGRSKLYQLVDDDEIESVAIKAKGKKRGVRLFRLQSILDYIERQAGAAK